MISVLGISIDFVLYRMGHNHKYVKQVWTLVSNGNPKLGACEPLFGASHEIAASRISGEIRCQEGQVGPERLSH